VDSGRQSAALGAAKSGAATSGAENFGAVLREYRAAAGLTQEKLADRAGVSARTVSDLERGVAQAPHGDTADRLAAGLGLTGPALDRFTAAARGRAAPGGPSTGPVGPSDPGEFRAPRTLPRDIGSFTGRDLELGALADAEAGLYVIGGMAGVGKTTLAVRAAYQLADRFPGGQVFLPLHGHTPGRRPARPADALAGLLHSIGADARRLPPGAEARARLWRDRVAGRRLLLVLDDAAGSAQVRPLLPGSDQCLVLVTSRRRLAGLDDATAVSLDTLATEQATELLVRLTARPGLDPADPDLARIAALCGGLPLALGLLGRRLHHRPAWSPADLAGELAAARSRTELIRAEDRSVAAAFGLSYAGLAPAQQRMFARLGLHPGPDVDAYAAAALGDCDPATAAGHLEALYDRHLISEPARGRYRLHDLIREYARDLAAPAGTQAPVGRLLSYLARASARAR
jgi:transcriptional regulator with XRE-family HTH domain